MADATVSTPAGRVPGQVIGIAPFCTMIEWQEGSETMRGWFSSSTGKRRGDHDEPPRSFRLDPSYVRDHPRDDADAGKRDHGRAGDVG